VVSFSADDLAALGHLIAVGQAVLQKRPPVVARLKAAMTRMAFHFRKVSWRFGRQGWALVSANNADFGAAAPSHRHLSWLSICDLWECDFPYCPLHRLFRSFDDEGSSAYGRTEARYGLGKTDAYFCTVEIED